MKFEISKVKLVRKRGLDLVDFILKMPKCKDNYITNDKILSYYKVSCRTYNGYSRIKSILVLPFLKEIKDNLGIKINVHKVNDQTTCFNYNFVVK